MLFAFKQNELTLVYRVSGCRGGAIASAKLEMLVIPITQTMKMVKRLRGLKA